MLLLCSPLNASCYFWKIHLLIRIQPLTDAPSWGFRLFQPYRWCLSVVSVFSGSLWLVFIVYLLWFYCFIKDAFTMCLPLFHWEAVWSKTNCKQITASVYTLGAERLIWCLLKKERKVVVCLWIFRGTRTELPVLSQSEDFQSEAADSWAAAGERSVERGQIFLSVGGGTLSSKRANIYCSSLMLLLWRWRSAKIKLHNKSQM